MMRKYRTAVLTGIAALAVVGVSLAAVRDTHTVKVALPDGSVARIEYSGDIAPKVAITPVSHAIPVGLADVFDSTPFAAFGPGAAELDRQAASTVHQAAQLLALPLLAQGRLEPTAQGKLPPGTIHYEFVATSSGNGACTRSVEMTSYGRDQKPRIVSASSGDCKPLDRAPTPVRLETPAHPSTPAPTKPRIEDSVGGARAGTTI
jgi:hypothetical protein